MQLLLDIATASWDFLLDASAYLILGMVMAGLLKSFLPADFIARHLGRGRILPVFKAALLGVPLPLCSCGVIPAAATLKRHGASNGATIAFMVATPESGVDSIAASYAMLDPLLTVARPVAALFSAIFAGLIEEFSGAKDQGLRPLPGFALQPLVWTNPVAPTPTSTADFVARLKAGLHYAFSELWRDLAPWFILGLLLSGIITALIPDAQISRYLAGGPFAMLIMLAVGIPIYICATASTPIAAALIMKGVSPGAALVFLLTGPATNLASLAILTGMLGKRGTLRYLFSLAATSLACGALLDLIYQLTEVSPRALIGRAAETLPYGLRLTAALVLLALSIVPTYHAVNAICARLRRSRPVPPGRSGCCPSDTCSP